MSVERLTTKNKVIGYQMKCSRCCEKTIPCNECEEFEALVDRIGIIEDILGDDYNLDHLQELVEAVRAKRCFAFPVVPSLSPGITSSEVFILLDSGEIITDTVGNILIAPNDSGDIKIIFDTFDSGYFGDDDVGKRIFWKLEDAQKAAAALKGGQDA